MQVPTSKAPALAKTLASCVKTGAMAAALKTLGLTTMLPRPAGTACVGAKPCPAVSLLLC